MAILAVDTISKEQSLPDEQSTQSKQQQQQQTPVEAINQKVNEPRASNDTHPKADEGMYVPE